MKKRIVSLLLALVMVLSLVPTTVWAAENHDGQVRVIVENTTYAKADGAAWDGTLVDKWVDLVPGSSMMDCIVSALGSYSQTGADSGYITEINGLTAGDGGAASGWMGTLNDWFTNVGFKDIKAGDKLFAGDVIRVMYTVNGYGADIGGDWNTQSDTSLAALSFSEGVLTPDFASDKTAYTLTLPQGVTGIRMTATASNKNNQVYLSADGTDYRRVETVPVHNGTVLTIRCGDAAAATEWSPAITPTTYTVTVSQEGDAPQGDMDVSFKGLHNAQLSDIKVYSYTDGVKSDKNQLEGVDIDPMCVRTAGENAERNGVAEHFTVLVGDLSDKASGKYNIITANIVAAAILSLAPHVPVLMAPGARFIASGIIDTRKDEVLAGLRAAGLEPVEIKEKRGWVCVICKNAAEV